MSDISQLLVGIKALLLVALVAGIGVIVLGEFQLTEETTTNVTNESLNLTHTNTGTWITLGNNNTLNNWVTLVNTTLSLRNTSHTYDNAVQAGNFTVDPVVGRVQITRTGQINASINASNPASGVLWNVTYQYTIGSEARDVFGDGILGVQEITGWLDIIGLAIVLSIVMYFVMNTLWQRRPEQRY